MSGDGDDEGAGAARLVGGGHNDVAVRVATETDDLGDFIPRHKLDGILVDKVVLIGSNASGVDVEAYHATHQVVADFLLPGFLRSGESDLDISGLLSLQVDGVLGVLRPSEVVLLLLELLVVQMAASCSSSFPLTRDNLVLRVFQLFDFNGSTAEHYMKQKQQHRK
jgi:hypothetical protein